MCSFISYYRELDLILLRIGPMYEKENVDYTLFILLKNEEWRNRITSLDPTALFAPTDHSVFLPQLFRHLRRGPLSHLCSSRQILVHWKMYPCEYSSATEAIAESCLPFVNSSRNNLFQVREGTGCDEEDIRGIHINLRKDALQSPVQDLLDRRMSLDRLYSTK